MAGKDYDNRFNLTYGAINAIKKKDLVDYSYRRKGRVKYLELVVADNHIL